VASVCPDRAIAISTAPTHPLRTRNPRAVPGRLVRDRPWLLERTWVNGERIWSSHRLRHGDEIRIGQTRLIFRDPLTAARAQTEAEDAPLSLTGLERDVLMAVCRPLPDRDMFTEPASTQTIADELVVTQAAVRQHLANVYDKFGVSPSDSNRRARLANEALRRGCFPRAAASGRQPVALR
jgi:FHA domain